MRTFPKATPWVFLCVIAALQMPTQVSSQTTLPQSAGVEQAVQLPRFDVVSVRETKSPIFQETLKADGYVGRGVNLNHLIMKAYGIPQLDRLAGTPAWSTGKRFDIQAKVDNADIPANSKLSAQQHGEMLKQILVERFQLTMHQEERVQPIYVLTVSSKPGPLLEKSRLNDGDSAPPSVRVIHRLKRGQLTEERFTMSDFANQLSGILHRFVVDQTNLDGLYDIQIDWNPDDALPTASGAADSSQPDSSNTNPSIFTALQEQLGLKLRASKGPVTVWVVDHVELPSDN